MASKVGEAVVKLSFDGSGMKSELNNAEKHVNNFGTKVKKVASNIGKVLAAGFATATAAAVAFSKKAVDAFNTQEEALAKLDQVAKNQNWSETAVEGLMAYNSELQKTGIIGDEIMAAGQAQLGTFALSEEAVRKLTPAMNDLIAATSGFGATTESATSMANLMGKVMTGNVGALTRYGVTLDENQKKLLETGDEMTRATVLAEVLANNYGDFNEALAKTPQGQVKQLANAFSDLQESFGAFIAGKGDLEEFFTNLSTVIDNAVNLVTTMAPQFIDGITKLIQQIGAKLPEIIKQLLPVILQAVSELTIAFFQMIPDFIDMLIEAIPMVIDAFVQLLDAMVAALPEIMPKLIDGITNLIITIALQLTRPDFLSMILKASITLLMELVKALPTILTALIGALPQIISNIISFLLDPQNLMMIIEAAVQLFMGLVMAVPQILGALIGAFGQLVGNLWDGITKMFGEFAANFGNFIGDIFKGAINAVIAFIEGFVNIPIDLLNGFIWVINAAFGWLGVNIGSIPRVQLPRLAEGGVAGGATTAIIGENGKEAVLPLENNTDNWSGLLASALAEKMSEEEYGGGTINVYMTNEINNKLDAEEIGRTMIQSIRRYA